MDGQSPSQIIPQVGRAKARAYDTAGWDRFLKTHPVTPLMIYGPIGSVLLWRSYKAPGFIGSTWLLVVGGLFIWTLLEYFIHRGLLHFADINAAWNMGLARIHARHHEHPEDISQVILSPVQTLPLCAVVYGVLRLFTDWSHAGAILTGIMAGYLCYESFHFAFHKPDSVSWRWLIALRKYHALHHFDSPDARFGVTSPLWDHVFRFCGL